MADLLLSLTFGYLLGAIPSAAIVARLKGQQIFEIGSGNMGAMNTARQLGLALGLLVLVMDIGKGALAVYLMLLTSPPWPLATSYAAGVGAVAGHAWSVFVGFRGGKALATAFGVSLLLVPLAGLAALVLNIALLLLLRHSSPAMIITAALYPLLTLAVSLHPNTAPQTACTAILSASLVATVVILKQLPALRKRYPKTS